VENFFERDENDTGRGFSAMRRRKTRHALVRARTRIAEIEIGEKPDGVCILSRCEFLAYAFAVTGAL
jgi:hypothetical protein